MDGTAITFLIVAVFGLYLFFRKSNRKGKWDE